MSLPQVKDYTLVEKLGSGSYSTVYKGFKKVCTRNRFEWRSFSLLFQKMETTSLSETLVSQY